jgi:anti-sigma factor RsiW
MTRSDDNKICAWVSDNIDMHIDGELSGESLMRFDSHVHDCLRCQHELASARRVLNELWTMPAMECPDEVIGSVHREVAAAQAVPKRQRFSWLRAAWFRPALAGAFTAVAIMSSLYIVDINRSQAPTAQEVAEAEAALRWTLAYVSDVSRDAVMKEAVEGGLVGGLQRAHRSMKKATTTRVPVSESDGGSI